MDFLRDNHDLKAWMQEHTQEYGEFAREMGEADLLETFLMGQAAFIAYPEFQKRLEDMVDTDCVNVGELLEILRKSGYLLIRMGTRIGRSTDCLLLLG